MDKAELDAAQTQHHQSTMAYNRSLERKELQIELALAEQRDRKRHAKTQVRTPAERPFGTPRT